MNQRVFDELANLHENVGDMIEVYRGLHEMPGLPDLHFSHWAIYIGRYSLQQIPPGPDWRLDARGYNLEWRRERRFCWVPDQAGIRRVVHFTHDYLLNRSCVFGNGCPGRVIIQPLEYVVNGRPCRVNNYVNGRRNAQEIRNFAMSWIGRSFNYHLIHSNCEHFATLCRSGISRSRQVETVNQYIERGCHIWNHWPC